MAALTETSRRLRQWAKVSVNDAARGTRLSMAMAATGRSYNCQLCYDVGVTESSLSRWRSGGPMSVSMAVRLSQMLGVSVDWLITGRTGKDPQPNEEGHELVEVASLFSILPPNDRQLVLELSGALLDNEAELLSSGA